MTEPTIAGQLRYYPSPELVERAAARLDELERELAAEKQCAEQARQAGLREQERREEAERQLENAQYWRDRHCRESEQHAQRSGENWKAWKAAEAQLATVAQAERERCAKIADGFRGAGPMGLWHSSKEIAERIRALAQHTGKEPEGAQQDSDGGIAW
jgi:hypothetical protein